MSSMFRFAIALGMLLGAGCVQARSDTDIAPPSDTKTGAASTAEIRHADVHRHVQTLADLGEFRGVVLVAQGDRILHRAAYGMADQDAGIANTPDTSFLIGSLTKSFTAATVMQLVEEGKLDLEAPISRYLPGLDRRLGDRLNLRMLLRQRSGLPTHLERIAPQGDELVSSADILALINRADLRFEPDTRHEYGNLNYHLAALAIEAATGQPFAEVLDERTFKPLGMDRSGLQGRGARPSHRAKGYSRGVLGWDNDENNMTYTLGSGDIHASADDLLRWSRALDEPAYLSHASRDAMFHGGGEADGWYGYGFRIQPYLRADGSSGRLVRHGGSMDGFLSNLHRYLDDDLTVIVLGNQRPFEVRSITRHIKRLALGMPAAASDDTRE